MDTYNNEYEPTTENPEMADVTSAETTEENISAGAEEDLSPSPESSESSYTFSPGTSYIPYEAPKAPKKRCGKIILAVALILGCICGSAAAGYFGARYATKQNKQGTSPLVLYRSAETSGAEEEPLSPVASIAAMTAPSVVEITTEQTIVSPLYQYVQTGAGSGVILTTDGYIVTCNHLVEASSGSGFVSSVAVTLTTGETYNARIIGADSDTDVALLKIDPDKELTPAVFPTENAQLHVGDYVIAIGNPLGNLGGSVSCGIISSLERKIKVENQTLKLLQTDTAINPGNSGGGLFNMKGELIGIVNAKHSASGIEGLGFAIPYSTVQSVIEQLYEYGYVRGKPFIGFALREVSDSSTAYYLYGRRSTGIFVDSLQENSPNRDVFVVGDKILAVNGIEITSASEILEMILASNVGDKMLFTVSRVKGNTAEIVTVEAVVLEYVPSGVEVKMEK